MIRRLPALLLAGLLISCVPVVQGTTTGVPLPLVPGVALMAQPGDSIFVEDVTGYPSFGYRPGDFDGAFWIPASARRETADVRTSFALRDVELPDGWSLMIRRMRAVRERVPADSTSASGEPSFIFSLRAVCEVMVAEDALPGSYQLHAALQARTGERQQLEFLVQVGEE